MSALTPNPNNPALSLPGNTTDPAKLTNPPPLPANASSPNPSKQSKNATLLPSLNVTSPGNADNGTSPKDPKTQPKSPKNVSPLPIGNIATATTSAQPSSTSLSLSASLQVSTPVNNQTPVPSPEPSPESSPAPSPEASPEPSPEPKQEKKTPSPVPKEPVVSDNPSNPNGGARKTVPESSSPIKLVDVKQPVIPKPEAEENITFSQASVNPANLVGGAPNAGGGPPPAQSSSTLLTAPSPNAIVEEPKSNPNPNTDPNPVGNPGNDPSIANTGAGLPSVSAGSSTEAANSAMSPLFIGLISSFVVAVAAIGLLIFRRRQRFRSRKSSSKNRPSSSFYPTYPNRPSSTAAHDLSPASLPDGSPIDAGTWRRGPDRLSFSDASSYGDDMYNVGNYRSRAVSLSSSPASEQSTILPDDSLSTIQRPTSKSYPNQRRHSQPAIPEMSHYIDFHQKLSPAQSESSVQHPHYDEAASVSEYQDSESYELTTSSGVTVANAVLRDSTILFNFQNRSSTSPSSSSLMSSSLPSEGYLSSRLSKNARDSVNGYNVDTRSIISFDPLVRESYISTGTLNTRQSLRDSLNRRRSDGDVLRNSLDLQQTRNEAGTNEEGEGGWNWVKQMFQVDLNKLEKLDNGLNEPKSN